jgi:hypothetical protein
VDPAQAVAEVSWPAKNSVEIWSRSDLSSNSLPRRGWSMTMRLSTPQPSKSVARMPLDETEDAGVERGDGRIEPRDQRFECGMNARTMLRGACGQCFLTAAATSQNSSAMSANGSPNK